MITAPIEAFLGKDACAGGPFALLGLRPEDANEDSIVAALEHRLAQVNAHTQCDTPQADEVRLALHASAAQLLDGAVRAHVLARVDSVALRSQREGDGGQMSVESSRRLRVMLERDAVRSIALHGGWNQSALEHLALVAHARGIPSDRVAATIRSLTFARRARPSRPSDSDATGSGDSRGAAEQGSRWGWLDAPTAETRSAKKSLWVGLAAIAGGTLVVGALVAWILTGLGTDVPQSRETDVARDVAPVPTRERATPRAPAIDLEESAVVDPTLVLRELDASVSELGFDVDAAVARFERGVGGFALTWPRMTPAEREVAGGATVDFLYRLDEATAFALVQRLVAGTQPDALEHRAMVRQAGLSALMSAIGGEADLPARVRAAAGPSAMSVREGFSLWSRWAARRIIEVAPVDPDVWQAWVSVTLAMGDADEATLLVLDGLEGLLRGGPEPLPVRGMEESLAAMVSALRWLERGHARGRVLEWFTDRSLSSGDLGVLTRAIASQSSAPGIDATMVLAYDADWASRERLGRMYAAAWGLSEHVEAAEGHHAWRAAMELAMAASEGSDGSDVRLAAARAVRFSRLSLAASHIWRGRLEDARELILLAGSGGEDVGAAGRSTGDERVDAWGLDYLLAGRGIPVREHLLETLQGGGVIRDGLVAELVVREALFGLPDRQIRQLAERIVLSQQESLRVLEAVRDQLGQGDESMLRRRHIELVSGLLGLDPLAVEAGASHVLIRRALVARIAALQGAEEFAFAEELSDELARLGLERARGLGGVRERGERGAAASARLLGQGWEREAVRLGGRREAIESARMRRRAARSLEAGPAHVYLAEMRLAAQCMSLALAPEKPAQRSEIETTIGQQESERVIHHIELVERGMARLWRIRLSGEEAM